MKSVLMLAGSKSGSWKIRGEQLGQAIGAARAHRGTLDLQHDFDLVVVVKRPDETDLAALHRQRTPIVWDVVDAWPQPMGNWWNRDLCLSWLKKEIRRIKPVGVVATTKVMADDLKPFGVPVLVLPHHARNLEQVELSAEIKTVGYEGGVQYLGYWQEVLRQVCKKRDWFFKVNPASLSELDIVVALRDQPGYAAKNWKSNVKLANAQGLGLPCVANREAAYLETASGAELWADNEDELTAALYQLELMNGARKGVSNMLHAAAPKLATIAAQYKEWLNAL